MSAGYTMMNKKKRSPGTMQNDIFVFKYNHTNGNSLLPHMQIYP